MNHSFQKSVLIMECIELNWLCKHFKKIKSSQPAIPVLNWVKHQSFPVSIVKLISLINLFNEFFYFILFFLPLLVNLFCCPFLSWLKVFPLWWNRFNLHGYALTHSWSFACVRVSTCPGLFSFGGLDVSNMFCSYLGH